jgi:ankyrin repeat protein
MAAVRSGSKEVVRLLLKNGAPINSVVERHVAEQEIACSTPLQMASLADRHMVRFLLENGADVTLQGGPCGTALQAASLSGNVKVVRVLIHEGADVNAQGGYFGNALQAASWAASWHGTREIVWLLLRKGADVNAQGGHYWTALQAAVAAPEPKKSLVRMLLKYGASANIRGGKFGSALQAAACKMNAKIIRILADAGAAMVVEEEFYDVIQVALTRRSDDYRSGRQTVWIPGASEELEAEEVARLV